jgi:hypothetical protein
MAEPRLDCPGVVTLVGQRVAAGVAQHMGMGLEIEACAGGGTLDHPGKASCRERGAPLADEEAMSHSPLRPAQGPEFVTANGMSARGAVLDAADVQHRGVEFDLIPTEAADLGRPEPVPESDQDHGGVPMPVPVRLGGLDQGLDLARRHVLPGPSLGVRTPPRSNCSIYFSRRDQLEVRFCLENSPLRIATVRSSTSWKVGVSQTAATCEVSASAGLRPMLPMRRHAFAEPAPINHTDHHRWRDPERVLRFSACLTATPYGLSRRRCSSPISVQRRLPSCRLFGSRPKLPSLINVWGAPRVFDDRFAAGFRV